MSFSEKIIKTIGILSLVPIYWLFFNKFAIYFGERFFKRFNPEVLESGFWSFAKLFFKAFGVVSVIMILFLAISHWF